jgi:N-acetylglucosamine kinase-like BadF-type ATPase
MSAAAGIPAVLAVDSGNSKIDAAVAAADGTVLAAARGVGCSFSPHDHDRSIERVAAVVDRVRRRVGVDGPLPVGVFCLAGADLPVDERRIGLALGRLGLAEDVLVRNDTFAVLRAGSDRTWGVGVVCGTGINCSAVAPNGRVIRYAAMGTISGDEGGGGWLGSMALWTAVRSRDGRGPRSALQHDVPAHFGLTTPLRVTEAIHTGRIDQHRLTELAPLVLKLAEDGDAPAAALVDQLADEVVAMVASAVRRLHLTRSDVDVVLGGGVMRSRGRRLLERASTGIHQAAPRARIVTLRTPPVVGSILLGLDRVGAGGPSTAERVRGTLTEQRLSRTRR